jgi:DNA (cytosine-5)-methyltransferase 1
MRYGSVCSGIEAASVAWHQLGWEAAWLAEIEPFPSSLLQHHYPSVPNYGDMTALADRVSNLEIEAPDVLVGGTPCQAFSVAGLRQSLDDDRGQLTIKFLELADAIDNVRRTRGEPECIIVWENVPGVLSTKDNALGCFLAGLAGESEPLLPAGGRWSDAGCVYGPERTIAWRVLDAQYFGVAQRRRRLFVVASARDGFDPAQVLFEFDGLRRDLAPSRTQRKDVAEPITAGIEKGCRGTEGIESNWAIPTYGIPGNWVGRKPENGGNAVQPMDDLSPNLTSTDRHAVASAVCFQQNTRDEVRLIGGEGNLVGALAANAGMKQTNYIAQATAFEPGLLKRKGSHFYHEHTGVIRSDPGDNAMAVAIGWSEELTAHPKLQGTLQRGGDMGEVVSALTAHSGETGKGDAAPCVAICIKGAAIGRKPENGPQYGETLEEVAYTQNCVDLHGVMTPAMQVRRLTPTECERLQGFPDGYTLVPHRGKPAADGPRYKSLGNSMAVPVMAWIGRRINQAIQEGEV